MFKTFKLKYSRQKSMDATARPYFGRTYRIAYRFSTRGLPMVACHWVLCSNYGLERQWTLCTCCLTAQNRRTARCCTCREGRLDLRNTSLKYIFIYRFSNYIDRWRGRRYCKLKLQIIDSIQRLKHLEPEASRD